ncbi:MAG TPA: SseB family protein [Rhodanobacter sp.]|nr:SseB family protein [Rhodanobacter sp.]
MASTEHLEALLKRAVLEPGTRPRFLKMLLASNAFVFIPYPEGEAQTVWNSQPIAWIRHDGAYVYPLFTSEEALAKAPLPGKTAFNVHVQSLFDANPNRHCIVNPGSTYEMQISADELAHALASIAQAGGATTLMLGARENAAIANSHPLLASKLMTFLAGISQVEQAYFLEAELSQLPSRPLQIAILVSESVQIAEAISKVVEGTYGKEQPAKVRIFLPNSPEYLSVRAAGIAPFYDREWGARLLTLESDAFS